MCVCVCVCVCVCMSVCACVPACTIVCVCVCLSVRVHACMHAWHMNVCVCMCACTSKPHVHLTVLHFHNLPAPFTLRVDELVDERPHSACWNAHVDVRKAGPGSVVPGQRGQKTNQQLPRSLLICTNIPIFPLILICRFAFF